MYIRGVREIDKKAFGQRLRQFIRDAEMTQAQLGKRAGITQQNISDYCFGRAEPSYSRMVRMARALRVSIFDLLGYSSEEVTDDLSRLKRRGSK